MKEEFLPILKSIVENKINSIDLTKEFNKLKKQITIVREAVKEGIEI